MEFKLISQDDLSEAINQIPHGISRGVLFSGVVYRRRHRYSCIDQAVALFKEGELIALGTIAPHGEMNSGVPTIVGIWVRPSDRHLGHGAAITQKVIERSIERGFEKIQLDAIVEPIIKIHASLTQGLKERTILKNFIIPGIPIFFD
ncbi:MAG: GNAT family N-acetyltransferase [Nostoc sp.]|uniref:GNAT family N-acetyltransferase n=1 Tax=Nostoc sp. TaxID=1180 RepID=UPI002FFD072D